MDRYGTDGNGQGDEEVSGAERARQALDQAKADARRRGAVPDQPGTSRGSRGGNPASARESRRGRGFPTGDPLSLSGAIDELLAERGWEVQVAAATVFARWPEIVGAELAAHTRPESFTEGELVVVADSAAWATQVRLLSGDLQRRVNRELGDTVAVQRVRVQGPGRSAGSPGGSFRREPRSH